MEKQNVKGIKSQKCSTSTYLWNKTEWVIRLILRKCVSSSTTLSFPNRWDDGQKKRKQNSQIQRKMVAKKVSFPRNSHGISICLIPNICADNL